MSRSSTIGPCAGIAGGAADFRAVLPGHAITAVRRRGKYLWWALDDGDAVIAHLGMSGQFRVGDRPGPATGAGHRRACR